MPELLIEPRWHPIAYLPVLAAALHDHARHARDQAHRMTQAHAKPGRLGRAELLRMERAYGEQAVTLDVFSEQLRQWHAECSSADAHETLVALECVLGQWRDDVRMLMASIRGRLDNTF